MIIIILKLFADRIFRLMLFFTYIRIGNRSTVNAICLPITNWCTCDNHRYWC